MQNSLTSSAVILMAVWTGSRLASAHFYDTKIPVAAVLGGHRYVQDGIDHLPWVPNREPDVCLGVVILLALPAWISGRGPIPCCACPHLGPCSPSMPHAVTSPVSPDELLLGSHGTSSACWCSVFGNTGTAMVSDVGLGWYFLNTIPSTGPEVSISPQWWSFPVSVWDGVVQTGVPFMAAGLCRLVAVLA